MRRNRSSIGIWICIISMLVVGGSILFLWPSGPERLVDEFYEYESEAEFGKSWDLLSDEMKLRFLNRADYVQNRAHVFMQHMEVEAFSMRWGIQRK